MATLTFEDKQINALIKKFHTLLGRTGGGSNAKEAILHSYGVASSRDLSVAQLIEACNALDKILNPKAAELDRLRKRAMAAIGGWLKVAGKESNAELIKGIACRATGYESFNKIPAERLRNLYYTFYNKQKDKESVDSITADSLVFTMCAN